MDMGVFRRAQQLLDRREPAGMDHAMLVAALAAHQAASATARAARAGDADPSAGDPLVELLTGGPEWRDAVRAQGGRFSRAEAGRDVKQP